MKLALRFGMVGAAPGPWDTLVTAELTKGQHSS
jgi:hypothetical protein